MALARALMTKKKKKKPVVKNFKIAEIKRYNVFGEWTKTDCHT